MFVIPDRNEQAVRVGTDRDKSLGFDIKDLETLANGELAKLHEPLVKMSTALVEGRMMYDGLRFEDGNELAWFLANYSRFIIAFLMDKGYISKTIREVDASTDGGEYSPGGYA